MPSPPDELIREAILRLLAARRPGATICPSEAARALEPVTWRPLMHDVVRVAHGLATAGTIEITQGGAAQRPGETLRGPIRLRLLVQP